MKKEQEVIRITKFNQHLLEEKGINIGECQLIGMAHKRLPAQYHFREVTLTFSTSIHRDNEKCYEEHNGLDIKRLQEMVDENMPGLYAIPRIYDLILVPKEDKK